MLRDASHCMLHHILHHMLPHMLHHMLHHMFHRIVRRRVSPYVYGLRIACHAVAHVALQWCLPVVIAGKLNDHSRSYELRGLSYHMLCPMLDRMLYRCCAVCCITCYTVCSAACRTVCCTTYCITCCIYVKFVAIFGDRMVSHRNTDASKVVEVDRATLGPVIFGHELPDLSSNFFSGESSFPDPS